MSRKLKVSFRAKRGICFFLRFLINSDACFQFGSRRAIAFRDALDFHPARPCPPRGDCLDRGQRDHHHGGWSLREPDHAESLRGLLSQRLLGAPRPQTPWKEQNGLNEAASAFRRELETKSRHGRSNILFSSRRSAGYRRG